MLIHIYAIYKRRINNLAKILTAIHLEKRNSEKGEKKFAPTGDISGGGQNV